ncbi:hypothetical protein COOONC_17320, partial [Cooperia oncophora]
MSKISRSLLLVTVIMPTLTYISIFCHMGFCSPTKLSKRELLITLQ